MTEAPTTESKEQEQQAPIAYFSLPPDLWGALIPVFEQHGGQIPDPAIASIVAAVDGDGKVVGFVVLQMALHLEPIWISKEARGRVSFRRLVDEAESLMGDMRPITYYSFIETGDSTVARMAQHVGMQAHKGWRVFMKTLE